MHIAVTGAHGFIGKAVIAELSSRGHTAAPIDRLSKIDILDHYGLLAATSDCHAVIHLAGVLGTAELFGDPTSAIDVNVKGTCNVLDVAAKQKLHYVGITMPEVWDNVYQATKKCARNLASAWHRHFNVPVTHVRAFNVFGPGQKVHGVQKIMPTFATAAWAGQPIPIWGDGTQSVDLIYVDDVARMLVDAIEVGGDDCVLDAGTAVPLSVNSIANSINEIAESLAGITYLPMRKGEHEAKVCATREGWERLDWEPQMRWPEFKETVEWYREPRP